MLLRSGILLFVWSPLLLFPQQQPAGHLERVLPFTQADSPQAFQDISIAIRNLTDASKVFVDNNAKTIAIQAAADRLPLAEWLLRQLDQPRGLQPPGRHEFRIPGPEGEVVRVVFLSRPELQSIGQLGGIVRIVAGVSNLVANPATVALILRGPAPQMAVADWLIQELDRPQPDPSSAHEFRAPGASDEAIKIFFADPKTGIQEFIDMVSATRTLSGLSITFPYPANKAVVSRGSADQLALTDWLIQEFEQPAATSNDATPPREYRAGSEVVKVYHLPASVSPDRAATLATTITTATQTQRAYFHPASRSLAIRGTPEQLAKVDDLIHDATR